MDVKMGYSGQLTNTAQITTVKSYYKGAILKSGDGAAVCSIAIHNCAAAATPSAATMVAELSLPAVPGSCIVDNPTGVVECPDGIRVIRAEGTVRFHIRYSVMPG